jgi:hypothetical protein
MGAPPQGASGMAIASLVLAIVSFLMCGIFTSIPGLIIGKMELGKIERGESPESGKILAQIGFWANVGISVLWLLIICLYAILFAAAIGTSASTSTYGGY